MRGSEVRKELASRALASRSLLEFTKRSHGSYQVSWHHRMIAERLEAVERGEVDRLMINMPPRHGKSELSSIRFPVWFLGRNPTKRVIAVSYSRELATDFGRKTRNLVKSEQFTNVFDASLSEDSYSVQKWDLSEGGGYVGVGIGGTIVGRGADIFLIDDPIKSADDADSATYRDAVWDWYQNVAYTRLEKGGAIVLTMTRWHKDDLAGRLTDLAKKDGWEVLSLPATGDANEKEREEGEALWPEKYDDASLKRIRENIGTRAFGAQYLQRPVMEESSIFNRKWFRFYEPGGLPHVYRYIWSWDTASKAKAQHDFSVGTFWAECENGFYLVYLWREKCIYTDLKRAILNMQSAWEADCVLIEDASSGIQLLQDLQETTSLPILPEKTEGRSKEARAVAISHLFESGKVFFPRNEDFVNVLVDELVSFPASKRKDQVDSVSQALRFMKRQEDAWVEWL